METRLNPEAGLAARITRAASKQTFYTIRWLVDRGRVGEAYQAYAYFRWVDDWLDQEMRPLGERLAFVKRQQDLIERCARGETPVDLSPEESMLASLMMRFAERASGLQAYIRSLMAVMAFDARRRGRLISQSELNEYTRLLALAVTECMHFFIGHDSASPLDQTRYLAVTGAHITHMLRDTSEDAEAGYFNLPAEVAAAHGILPKDVESQAYRNWVKGRVEEARECFRVGREYLSRVESMRCRIAGYAYMRRFEVVLAAIERDGYLLRGNYPETAGVGRTLESIAWALWMALTYRRPASASSAVPVR